MTAKNFDEIREHFVNYLGPPHPPKSIKSLKRHRADVVLGKSKMIVLVEERKSSKSAILPGAILQYEGTVVLSDDKGNYGRRIGTFNMTSSIQARRVSIEMIAPLETSVPQKYTANLTCYDRVRSLHGHRD